ncbi:putative membrane protein [Pseudomonas putida S610]|nr:putative membrane protein [Pseudomonas putida S610]
MKSAEDNVIFEYVVTPSMLQFFSFSYGFFWG